jgi:8-oxo-dGTP pyrophosphatase MutT (NUDIX family)
MKKDELFSRLRQRMNLPLPGLSAQVKMAPPGRLSVEEYLKRKDAKPTKSAVLISLFPDKDSIFTVFILRPQEQGVHSNQISFPGGKSEPHDKSLEETALRETSEEVGIHPDEVAVIGHLTSIYIPVSNYLVLPVLGLMDARPHFSVNFSEVKQVIECDCRLLLDPAAKGHAQFTSGAGSLIDAPYYRIHHHLIWGATAMMISELEVVLQEVDFGR